MDSKGRPVAKRELYPEYFKAFAVWEEAFLRPVVMARFGKRISTVLAMTRRLNAILSREVKLPAPKSELDRQIGRMHLKLTESAESLNALLDEEQKLVLEIHNTLLLISEDMNIRQADLERKLRRLKQFEEKLIDRLVKRADSYDFWLVLLQGKGLNLRFTRRSATTALLIGAVSTAISRNPLSAASASLPFLRYAVDQVSGVRKLRRAARKHQALMRRIMGYLEGVVPEYDDSLTRLPRASAGP